jgi:alpha-amylase/alpha-mannosidase (GH57 family)
LRYIHYEKRESIQKTVAAFEKVLGQKPTGYLSPGHASTPHTLELVAEAGFVWWARRIEIADWCLEKNY